MKMPNLLQGVKIEYNIEFLMQPQENNAITDIKKVTNLYKQSKKLLGTVPKEFEKAINAKLKEDAGKVRKEKWKNYRSLPNEIVKMYNCNGEYSDVLTALNALPKVKISEFRKLANKFNMVIIPVEYTEIDKIFDAQENKSELKSGSRYFNELLRQDTTTNYQSYILCPIDLYNVWEQIKSDKILNVYYPDYFENIFSTLELIIPTQKNLYLASKTNDENLKALSSSFDTNIKTLNDKITSISNKVDKLEIEFIKEKARNLQAQRDLEAQNQVLRNTVLQQQREIRFAYSQLDPILFAVPEGTNVVEDDFVSIVGLCWGEEIDEMIFDMKGITIEHKDLTTINPLNIKSKMENNFVLEYGKIIDVKKYVLDKIKENLTVLNKKRFKENWHSYDSNNKNTTSIDLFKDFKIFFEYGSYYSNLHLSAIKVYKKNDPSYIVQTSCDRYDSSDLYNNSSDDDFFKVYKKYFNAIARDFNAYCEKNDII